MVRGEIFRLRRPRDARGAEQGGTRFAVVVQADEFLGLGTAIVAPTSASALPAAFRPEVVVDGGPTRVLVEQVTTVALERLGASAGRLEARELSALDEALRLVLAL